MSNETLADILAEMRSPFSPTMRSVQEALCNYADRIEAAAKRERDPLAKLRLCKSCKHLLPEGCEICGCSDYVESDTIHPAPAPGNAAALREALAVVIQLADDGMIQPRAKGHHDEYCFVVALGMARAALAAPPRNCDVGTPEEQSVRMAEFCRAQYEKVANFIPLCSGCQFDGREGLDCQFAWAQMPYEGGGQREN